MTEVLQSPSQLPSPSSCSSSPCGGSHQSALINSPNTVEVEGVVQSHLEEAEEEEEEEEEEGEKTEKDREGDQLSILTLLIATFRKSLIGCSASGGGDLGSSSSSSSAMEIGWPSNVRHVAHVTFDRFHGFLGLPVEFEPEVPRRPPSARYWICSFLAFA